MFYFCFTVEHRIQLDKIRVTLAVFKEEQVTKIGMQSTHLVAQNSLIIFFKEKIKCFYAQFFVSAANMLNKAL